MEYFEHSDESSWNLGELPWDPCRFCRLTIWMMSFSRWGYHTSYPLLRTGNFWLSKWHSNEIYTLNDKVLQNWHLVYFQIVEYVIARVLLVNDLFAGGKVLARRLHCKRVFHYQCWSGYQTDRRTNLGENHHYFKKLL